MTVETYDDLKRYVGSKDNFTDDLLNMGYSKGRKDGYNQALDDFNKKVEQWCWVHEDYNQDDLNDLMEIAEQLKEKNNGKID